MIYHLTEEDVLYIASSSLFHQQDILDDFILKFHKDFIPNDLEIIFDIDMSKYSDCKFWNNSHWHLRYFDNYKFHNENGAAVTYYKNDAYKEFYWLNGCHIHYEDWMLKANHLELFE